MSTHSKPSGPTRQFGRPISLNTLNVSAGKSTKSTLVSLKTVSQLVVEGDENAKMLRHKVINDQAKKSACLKPKKMKKKNKKDYKKECTSTKDEEQQPQPAQLGWLTEKSEPRDCDYYRLVIQERLKALVECWEENDRLESEIEELKTETQLQEEMIEQIAKMKDILSQINGDDDDKDE